MKQTTKRRLISCIALLLTLSIVLGLATAAFAAEPEGKKFDLTDADGDGKFHYVSIGASNTNGYGIRGYIDEDVIEGVVNGTVDKSEVNVYGYQRSPEGSYTDRIRDYIQEQNPGVEVVLNQLAISSMRAEEVRVLLDNDYYGDKYTQWRFINGWFDIAEPGGMDALRATYQTSVKEADLITVDIGWNNFGVYVCNSLTTYLESGKIWKDIELTKVLGEENAHVAAHIVDGFSSTIKGYLSGAADLNDEDIEFVSKVFSYALVGYIVSFDEIMEKIYTANPDAQVVVLGIQNLLDGAYAKAPGFDKLPLGMIYGQVVNMANVYLEKYSPYKDKYIYTMTGNEQGHVHTFLDEIVTYDGNPETLNVNIKDCFDLYDEDLMLKYTLQYMMGEMYKEELAAAGVTAAQFVAMGEAGQLAGTPYESYYTAYVGALNQAYDTAAKIMQYVAKMNTLDLAAINGDINAAEDALEDYLWNSILAAAMAGMNGEPYEPDFSIFEDGTVSFAGIINVRFYVGNSFFAHPSDTGHKEIFDDVIQAAAGGKVTTVTTMFEDSLKTLLRYLESDENITHTYGDPTWTWAEDHKSAEAVFACTVSGCTVKETKTAAVTEQPVAATCTEGGKTVYTAKVTFAEKEYTDVQEVANEKEPATGHTPKAVEAVDATCEKPGTKAHFACACGALFADEKAEKPVTAEELVIPAGHVYGEPTWDWKAGEDGTYTVTATLACTRKDCTQSVSETAAVKKESTPATCTEAGRDVYTATVVLLEKPYADTKIVDIPVLPHTLTEVKEVVGDCEKDGAKAHFACSVCEKLFADKDGKTEVKAADLVVPAAHKLEEVKEVAATCGKDGTKAHYACSVCKKLFADKEGKTEAKAEDLLIPAGHKLEDGICTVCGVDTNTYKVYRVYGENRYQTGFAVADQMKEVLGVDKFQAVIVASGTNFADALAGSYLAAQKDAPILLVNIHNMVNVKNYIRANVEKGGTIYLLGGKEAISASMETGLAGYTVTRLAGDNRYDTNLAILMEAGLKAEVADQETAKTVKAEGEPEETKPEETKPEDTKPKDTKPEDTKPEDTKPEDTKPEDTKPEDTKPEEPKPEEETKEPVEILVCTGRKFADSLSASALGKPILLVRDTLSQHQKAYLKTLGMEINFVIIGGESAVSAGLEKELKAYGTTDRVGGENRFETSVLLAQRFLKDADPRAAVLAYAKKFPDGLCGGPLAYSMKAPLILTMTGMEKEAAAYTKDNGIVRGYVLGGDGLISDDAARTIFAMEETDKIPVK